MDLTLEQFQKDALPWLTKLNQTGQKLLLVCGEQKFEVRPAPSPKPREALGDLQALLPKRDIIVGDPEELVHLDWSAQLTKDAPMLSNEPSAFWDLPPGTTLPS